MSDLTQKENTGEKIEGIPQGQDPTTVIEKWFSEGEEKPWETLKPGETKTFIFMMNKMQKVEKEFQGTKKTQYRFTVINESNVEKTIDFSPRWAKMIFDFLKEGFQKIKITRKGMGTDTEYQIVPMQH